MRKFITRILKLPKEKNIFVFGARNTGKSTLVRHEFPTTKTLLALPEVITHVVIDEIQKIPKLLNVVHYLIENTNKKFILTGSSARKLKYGGANLLAGRAFIYSLYPLTFVELGDNFDLQSVLQWGSLPQIYSFTNDEEKNLFLQAYSLTYLKEEIWGEHFIRKLDPFRKFIEVAAQCNGKIINYSNIARDVGVDAKTVMEYFSILEDTLIGFHLEAFQHSFRKRLSQKPKFYFFDLGIVRALTHNLNIPLKPQTSAYGEAFEHFIILECIRLASYNNKEFRFSYLNTKDNVEIDLVVERPGQSYLFIEIKSSFNVRSENLYEFAKITKDFNKYTPCEAICFSNDPISKQYDHIQVIPWQEGLLRFFGKKS
jgi:predicted AAA+ superfamily ATPase